VGRGAIGNILLFLLAAVGIFMFLAGRSQERFGLRAMVMVGVLVCALNALLAASIRHLVLLYLWAFINGLSSCFVYIPALTCVQQWYPGRRGLVSGAVNLAFAVSAAITSPLFAFMLKTIGYQMTNYLISGMVLVTGIVAAQFTVPPPSHGGERVDAVSPKPGETKAESPSLSWSESVRSPTFWYLWSTWALQGAAGISMVTLAVPLGVYKGFDPEKAVLVLVAFNLANGLSRIVAGFISDLVGRTSVMSLAFFASGIAYWCLLFVENPLLVIPLVIAIGFAFGTLFAVSVPLATDCFGLKYFGSVYGLIFTAYGFISGPLGPTLSGYLLDIAGGDFVPVLIYLGLCSLLAGVSIKFVRPKAISHPLRLVIR
jgi:OFA family oxalate/formate antiporter-like MFS transporter